MFQSLRIGLVLTACFLFAGCSGSHRPEPPKVPVSGTVTLDGKPLAEGVIYFKTVSLGALDSVDIKDGRFNGKAQFGERRVEICSYEKIPADPNNPISRESMRNTLPARYSVDSTLTANVTEKGPNTFNFELTSQ